MTWQLWSTVVHYNQKGWVQCIKKSPSTWRQDARSKEEITKNKTLAVGNPRWSKIWCGTKTGPLTRGKEQTPQQGTLTQERRPNATSDHWFDRAIRHQVRAYHKINASDSEPFQRPGPHVWGENRKSGHRIQVEKMCSKKAEQVWCGMWQFCRKRGSQNDVR